jgi:hypothetical protein
LCCGQVSARFWLMDCRNVAEATKMATNLYKEAIHVPFMSKFVVFSKRHEQLEVSLLRLNNGVLRPATTKHERSLPDPYRCDADPDPRLPITGLRIRNRV